MTKPRTYYARRDSWLFWEEGFSAGPWQALPCYCAYSLSLYKTEFDQVVEAPAYRVGQRGRHIYTDEWCTLIGAWWDGFDIRYNWKFSDGRVSSDMTLILALC